MQEKKKFEITADSNIMEVIKNVPEAAEVFVKHGLPCVGCAAAHFEKLSDIALEFGIETKALIEEIKESANK